VPAALPPVPVTSVTQLLLLALQLLLYLLLGAAPMMMVVVRVQPVTLSQSNPAGQTLLHTPAAVVAPG
jgi:hypothetical protein